MTNKQIIIDSVDVSECIFHSLTTMGYVGYNYCKCFECVCKCHNDCYYKQLKRKEQECKELKEDEKSLLNVIDNLQKTKNEWQEKYNDLGQDFDQLKAENEKLKKQVCGLRPELKPIIDETCCKYNIEAKTYHKKIVEIINNLDKYEQTLVEIKEIAENMNNECFYDDFDCKDYDMKNGCTYQGKIKILQKIIECGVEDD